MKSILSKTWMLVAISASLLSFAPNRGGENFEIFLNNKLVIQRYGNNLNEVKSLALDKNGMNDKLTIKYFHCGRIGKNRIVAIKNGQDKVVKNYRFADVSDPVSTMSIQVKDILDVKAGNTTLKLFYSSTELPNGRVLATIP